MCWWFFLIVNAKDAVYWFANLTVHPMNTVTTQRMQFLATGFVPRYGILLLVFYRQHFSTYPKFKIILFNNLFTAATFLLTLFWQVKLQLSPLCHMRKSIAKFCKKGTRYHFLLVSASLRAKPPLELK